MILQLNRFTAYTFQSRPEKWFCAEVSDMTYLWQEDLFQSLIAEWLLMIMGWAKQVYWLTDSACGLMITGTLRDCRLEFAFFAFSYLWFIHSKIRWNSETSTLIEAVSSSGAKLRQVLARFSVLDHSRSAGHPRTEIGLWRWFYPRYCQEPMNVHTLAYVSTRLRALRQNRLTAWWCLSQCWTNIIYLLTSSIVSTLDAD